MNYSIANPFQNIFLLEHVKNSSLLKISKNYFAFQNIKNTKQATQNTVLLPFTIL